MTPLDKFDFNSLMDWDKPFFFKSNRKNTSMYNVIARTSEQLDKSQKLLDRIESAEQTARENVQSIPRNATIKKEYIRCGKPGCEQEPHGPYYYAYWKEEMKTDGNKSASRKKLKKKYIGTRLPNAAIRP
jgi:hypothetical protein